MEIPKELIKSLINGLLFLDEEWFNYVDDLIRLQKEIEKKNESERWDINKVPKIKRKGLRIG